MFDVDHYRPFYFYVKSLEEPRFRELIKGVQEASATVEVVDAFAVLYEDYLPIRAAGRTIFKAIDNRVTCAADRLRYTASLRNTFILSSLQYLTCKTWEFV